MFNKVLNSKVSPEEFILYRERGAVNKPATAAVAKTRKRRLFA